MKDKYPLLRIDDLIDKLHGATVLSSLDLQSGYHQISIAEKDVHKKAFITSSGLCEYRVVPFGLCNAPSAFQRQMNQMLGHLPFAVVYLDDSLVFSRNKAEHQVHLRTVLSILHPRDTLVDALQCPMAAQVWNWISRLFATAPADTEEQELLAVTSALRNWRCSPEGAKGGVTIVTDHLPNIFLDTKSAEQLSRRQVRWQLELSRINPNWVYEKDQTKQLIPSAAAPKCCV